MMRLCFRWLCAGVVASAGAVSWAGGSGLNVVVVVNQSSTNSMQLANAYCEERQVPPLNVLRITNQWSGGSDWWSVDEFQNDLSGPLLAMLASRGLSHQIQFVLLSMDIPYQVVGTNGINSTTAALFYGFKPDTAPSPGLPISCSLPEDSTNSYALSELPFELAPPDTAATNSFLAVMLTDTNVAEAERTLSRGVAGDSSFPTQTVYLAKTTDAARSVRFYEFDNAIFDTLLAGNYAMMRVNTDSTAFTNVLGMQTGLENLTLATNAFVPGAMGDSLTSYAGLLFEPSGQTPALAFLEAGAVASYGTVVEPCNFLQKFPNPLDYFYQSRGFCLAEAYYQSLQNPYQGILVGEPLCAPFARRGLGVWTSLPAGPALLSGQTNLQVEFFSAATNLPLAQVDLYVDGVWFSTVTNIPPQANDLLSVNLNGAPFTYTVPANATIASVAAGLAAQFNLSSNFTGVSAGVSGDRIELHSLHPAVPGADVTLRASASHGAMSATTFLQPARANFLDSIATGWHNVTVNNTPAVGDWLELQVTKTNGSIVTLGVTNSATNETIGQLVAALFDQVSGVPAWQSADGVYAADFDDESANGFADFNLYAQSPGWPASGIQVTLSASPDLVVYPAGASLLQDNLSDLQPRNWLYVASGALDLPAHFRLDTTGLADGCHQLTAVAREGTSVSTQTSVCQSVRIQNTALSAVLNTLYGGSNTDVSATLQFSVVVNTNNTGTAQLFSTGGLIGTVSNQSTAFFSIAATNLGLGLHPFYALVTAGNGRQYQTATTCIRLLGVEPPFSIVSRPPTLSWPATAGRDYNVLTTTNLTSPFQVITTVIPSNGIAQWMDTNAPSPQRFYRVQASY